MTADPLVQTGSAVCLPQSQRGVGAGSGANARPGAELHLGQSACRCFLARSCCLGVGKLTAYAS